MVIHRSYLTLFVVFPIAFSTIFSLVQLSLSLSLSQLAPLFRGILSLHLQSWRSSINRFLIFWEIALPCCVVVCSPKKCFLQRMWSVCGEHDLLLNFLFQYLKPEEDRAHAHTHTRAATPILLTLLVHRASTLHWQYILGFFFFSYFPNLFRSRSSLHFVMCTRVTGN